MKEKFKNLFKNKNFWIGLSYSLILIFSTLFSYSKGFVDGVLIDDDFRTELIDTTLNETKKSNIEPKKVNDIVKLNPIDYYGKYSKVGFNFTNSFVSDFYTYACDRDPTFYDNYNLYASTDDIIYLVFSFDSSEYPTDFYSLELSINDNFFSMAVGQGIVNEVYYSGIFEQDMTHNASNPNTYFSELNTIIHDSYYELGLDNYYLNITEFGEDTGYNDFSNYVYVYDIQKPKTFLSDFLSGAVDVVTGFGAVLTASVVGIGSIFYSNGELTIVGSAMALALGIGAIYLLFRMIRGLIKQNNRG